MTISLTGFMGCGKSSVGRRLSELLCCPFMDLDAVIEEKAGRRIPEIFASDGEKAFRRMEHEVLKEIISQNVVTDESEGAILALGGGAVMTEECAELVHQHTICIYLRASVDTLVARLEGESEGRPLLSGNSLRERIMGLMALRAATYEKTAHITIDTDGKSIETVVQEIRQVLRVRGDL